MGSAILWGGFVIFHAMLLYGLVRTICAALAPAAQQDGVHQVVVTAAMVASYKEAYRNTASFYTEDMKIAHAMEVALR